MLLLCAADYVWGTDGTNTCPTGSARILEEEACRTAATAVGKNYGGIQDFDVMPRGCFLHGKADVLFLNPSAVGASYSGSQLLCAGAPALIARHKAPAQISSGIRFLSGARVVSMLILALQGRSTRIARHRSDRDADPGLPQRRTGCWRAAVAGRTEFHLYELRTIPRRPNGHDNRGRRLNLNLISWRSAKSSSSRPCWRLFTCSLAHCHSLLLVGRRSDSAAAAIIRQAVAVD